MHVRRAGRAAGASAVAALLCAVLALVPAAGTSSVCLNDGSPCTTTSDCCGTCFTAECPAHVAPEHCRGLCRGAGGAAAIHDADATAADADEVCEGLGAACGAGVECCDDMQCNGGQCAAPLAYVPSTPRKLLDDEFLPPPNQPRPCDGRRRLGQRCLRNGTKLPCKAHLRCAWYPRPSSPNRRPLCRRPPHPPIYQCALLARLDRNSNHLTVWHGLHAVCAHQPRAHASLERCTSASTVVQDRAPCV